MNALGDWVVVSSSGLHRQSDHVLTHSGPQEDVRSNTMAESDIVQVEPSLLKEVRDACVFAAVMSSAARNLALGRGRASQEILWCRDAQAASLIRAADRQDCPEASRCREGALGPREGPEGHQRHPTPVPRLREGFQECRRCALPSSSLPLFALLHLPLCCSYPSRASVSDSSRMVLCSPWRSPVRSGGHSTASRVSQAPWKSCRWSSAFSWQMSKRCGLSSPARRNSSDVLA